MSPSLLHVLASTNLEYPDAEQAISDITENANFLPFPNLDIDFDNDLPNVSMDDINPILDIGAFANINDIDLEQKLSEQFRMSSVAFGVSIETELAMNANTLSSDFRANLLDNSFVKAGAFISTTGGFGFSGSMVTGLVDINVSFDLSTFNFTEDSLSVEIDFMTPNYLGIANATYGVLSAFGVEGEVMNAIGDVLEVINVMNAALNFANAVSGGLLTAVAGDPEPVSKFVLAVITLIISVLSWMGSVNLKEDIKEKSKKAEKMTIDSFWSTYWELFYLYIDEYANRMKPISQYSLSTPADLNVSLDGTDLVFTTTIDKNLSVMLEIVDLCVGQITTGITLKSAGTMYQRFSSKVDRVASGLLNTKFLGGYYAN